MVSAVGPLTADTLDGFMRIARVCYDASEGG
jgi:hypothetical protein